MLKYVLRNERGAVVTQRTKVLRQKRYKCSTCRGWSPSDVGLHLEQVTGQSSGCPAPLENATLTSSALSNDSNEARRQSRSTSSITGNRLPSPLYRRCQECPFHFYVFKLRNSEKPANSNPPGGKMILRNAIIAAAHQTYLHICFRAIRSEQAQDEN